VPSIHPRDVELRGVQPAIFLRLMAIEEEFGLTDCEMLEILNEYVGRKLHYFVKHEREEPDDTSESV